MATMTLGGVAAERKPKPKRGLLARILERMAEAQMQRARAVSKQHLLAIGDEELKAIGYTREEIERWPSGARWI